MALILRLLLLVGCLLACWSMNIMNMKLYVVQHAAAAERKQNVEQCLAQIVPWEAGKDDKYRFNKGAKCEFNSSI